MVAVYDRNSAVFVSPSLQTVPPEKLYEIMAAQVPWQNYVAFRGIDGTTNPATSVLLYAAVTSPPRPQFSLQQITHTAGYDRASAALYGYVRRIGNEINQINRRVSMTANPIRAAWFNIKTNYEAIRVAMTAATRALEPTAPPVVAPSGSAAAGAGGGSAGSAAAGGGSAAAAKSAGPGPTAESCFLGCVQAAISQCKQKCQDNANQIGTLLSLELTLLNFEWNLNNALVPTAVKGEDD